MQFYTMKLLRDVLCLILTAVISLSSVAGRAQEENSGEGRRGRDRGGEFGGGPGDGEFSERRGFGRRGRFGGDSGGPPEGFPGGEGIGGQGPFGGGGFDRRGFGGGGFDRGGFESGGRDRSSRFNAMLDRDGNGQIDQNEIDQMPGFMQALVRSRGIEISPGMSVDDIRDAVRNSSGGGGPWGDRGDGSGRDGNARTGDTKPIVRQPYRQKERPRVTVDLPPRYSELDDDLDGQIAYHEWLAERRQEIEQFELIDVDGDAFLTPQELADHEQSVKERAEAQKPASGRTTAGSRLKIVGPSTVTTAKAGNNDGRDSRSGSMNETDAAAQRAFERMDQNRNDRIESDEWVLSRRTRSLFEDGGVATGEMSRDEFMKNYVRLNPGSGR